MDFAGNFRARGVFDVGGIRRALARLPDSAWSDAVAKAAPVHRHSMGLFLKNDLRPEHLYSTVHPLARRLESAFAPLVDGLKRRLGDVYLLRLQLSRHQPGYGFDPHTDRYSFTLSRCRRIHVAVETNAKVWFSVGGERRVMGEGEAWEINNMREHAGRNEGASPRVHVIADFAPRLPSVAERLRYFANLDAVVAGLRFPGTLLARPQLDGEPRPTAAAPRRPCPRKAAGRVEPGLAVWVNYRLTDARTGETLAADLGEEPLVHVHGRGQLPPGLERPLRGLRIGAAFRAEVPPEEGYGEAGQRHPFAGRRLRWEGRILRLRALDAEERALAVYEGPSVARR